MCRILHRYPLSNHSSRLLTLSWYPLQCRISPLRVYFSSNLSENTVRGGEIIPRKFRFGIETGSRIGGWVLWDFLDWGFFKVRCYGGLGNTYIKASESIMLSISSTVSNCWLSSSRVSEIFSFSSFCRSCSKSISPKISQNFRLVLIICLVSHIIWDLTLVYNTISNI